MFSSTSRIWTAYAPFAAVALLAELTLLFGPTPVQHEWALVVSAALLVVMLPIGFVLIVRTPSVPLSAPLTALLPFVFLVIVALWRHASGGSSSGLTAMVGLSVLWLGLHGTWHQVWAGVAGVAVVLGAPLLVPNDEYPLDDWPRAVLYTAFAALLGPITHQLVTNREQDARRIRALEPSDSRFRGLLEAAVGHAVVSTDRDGMVTVFNPGAERLLGWQEAQVVGRLPMAALVPVRELGERARELGVEPGFDALVASVREGGSETRDWTWLTKDGQRRTVLLTMSGVRDRDGALTGYIGIGTDVTEQRRFERRLATQQEVLRLVVDHLPSTVVGLLDHELRWVTIAGQWLVDNAIDPASFTGMLVGERMGMSDPDGLRDFLRDSFDGGGQGDFETAAGVWFEIETEPVTGSGGERLLLMVCRDITARREADAERTDMLGALRASEEGFRTAFESAPVGIALTTVDQGPSAEFLRVNQAFADLIGRERADVEGLLVDDVTHPEDVGERPDLSTGSTGYQTRYLRPSGHSVWVSVHAAQVADSQGRPAYVIGHAADITDRRASEQALFDALEQQRAATTALREVDELRVDTMSTISHELRTPLTSIEGYLELLSDGVPGVLNDEQAQMLSVVRRNSERLRALVDDLLELSRLDHQQGTAPGDEAVDLAEVARGVIETVRPVASRKHQQLVGHLGDAPLVVTGSAEQLDRALTNLVANAVKYTAEGGRIDVALTLDDSDAGAVDRVLVEVRDTGIGIPTDELKRLFDRFYRASTAQRRGIEGTGLGLAIVKSIVERHDGVLSVHSEPGRGSVFAVSLPRGRAPDVPVEAPAEGRAEEAQVGGSPEPSR